MVIYYQVKKSMFFPVGTYLSIDLEASPKIGEWSLFGSHLDMVTEQNYGDAVGRILFVLRSI